MVTIAVVAICPDEQAVRLLMTELDGVVAPLLRSLAPRLVDSACADTRG